MDSWKSKIIPFSPLFFESEAILSKKFSFRLPGLECSYGKIFIWFPRDLGPGFWYQHIKIFTNGGVARRYLGNRATPVDRTYMKRPFKCFSSTEVVKSVNVLVRLWGKLDIQIKVNNISYGVSRFSQIRFDLHVAVMLRFILNLETTRTGLRDD